MAGLEDSKITFYHMKKCPFSGPIKLLLAHLNINYTDEPIKLKEWVLKREEIITYRVPALRIQHRDGKLQWMTEASAIMRCLGMHYNLLGRNDMEAFYCDRIIGKITESGQLLQNFFKNRKYHDADQEDYAKFKEKLFKDMSVILQHIDRMLHDVTGSFAAGDKITIADFYLLDFVDFLRGSNPECLAPYPNLLDWRKYLLENDQPVARFTASRSLIVL